MAISKRPRFDRQFMMENLDVVNSYDANEIVKRLLILRMIIRKFLKGVLYMK